jgi:hypothetical protein
MSEKQGTSAKPAPLTAGLLSVKGNAAPAKDTEPRSPEPSPPAENVPSPEARLPPLPRDADEGDRNDAPLNFRVSPAFRREFKTFAAQNDLKLNELLRRAFDTYKRHEGK